MSTSEAQSTMSSTEAEKEKTYEAIQTPIKSEGDLSSVDEKLAKVSTFRSTKNEGDFSPMNEKLAKIPSLRSTKEDIEKVSPEADSDETPRQITGFRWFLVCVSLYVSALIYGLDTTIVADVQAAVVATFGEVEQLAWVGAGFSLGSVATILPIAALFSKFNQKWLYIASIAIFEIGSAVCGAAPNMNALIVGRVIAGIGGSGIYLGVLNYLTMTTTTRERGTYIALTGFVWGLGAILGPVIGGAFSVSSATWRWAFYINLVVAAVSAPVYFLYLPPMKPTNGVTVLTRLSHIDWLGFALSAGFWVVFTVLFTFAGTQWAWSSGQTIALFVVFAVLLIAFALQQYFLIFTTAEYRSFPLQLLKSRTQVLLYIGTSAATSALFIPVYYIPLYFQFVKSDTAIQAAVRLLPFVLLAITMNLGIGALLPKIGYYMPVYLISGLFIVAGGATLHTIDAHSPVSHIYGFSILTAIGAGLTLQTGYSVATVSVRSAHDIMGAISMQNFAQIGSTVLALVISGQLFQSYAFRGLSEVLGGQGFSPVEIRGAVAGEQSEVFRALEGELRDAAVEAITAAIQKVYVLVIVAGAMLVLASLGMRRERILVSAA